MIRLGFLPLFVLPAACAVPPPPSPAPMPLPAPAPSAVYRATGTEPFWSLVLDGREMTFSQPEAAPIRQPQPRAIVGFAGEIYQSPRIRLNIVHAQCSDGMSDRTYPDKVQVDVDGKRYDGCGGL